MSTSGKILADNKHHAFEEAAITFLLWKTERERCLSALLSRHTSVLE